MSARKALLLIDDEVIVRKMLAAFLRPFFDVYTAGDAFEALEIIFGFRAQALPCKFEELSRFIQNHVNTDQTHEGALLIQPDLIVADIKMPKINGFQLIHLLRRYLPDIPVFMITGFEDEGYNQEVIRLKINEILAKPFSPMLLLDKIKETVPIQPETNPS